MWKSRGSLWIQISDMNGLSSVFVRNRRLLWQDLQVVFCQEFQHQRVELVGSLHAGHVGDIVEDHLARIWGLGSELLGGCLAIARVEIAYDNQDGNLKLMEAACGGRIHGAWLTVGALRDIALI